MNQEKELPICGDCEHKSSAMINEGTKANGTIKLRLHFLCKNPDMKTMRFTEHGETWFATWREIKNTRKNPDWCPLRSD